LTSSRAWRFVGSENRDEEAFAALDQRQYRCFRRVFSLTSRTISEVGLDGVEIEQGGTELLGRRNGDLAGVGEVVFDQVADNLLAALAGGDQASATRLIDQPIRH